LAGNVNYKQFCDPKVFEATNLYYESFGGDFLDIKPTIVNDHRDIKNEDFWDDFFPKISNY
jgi:hypothetical protein